MQRNILTGSPGSGKTAVLRLLEVQGFGVVEDGTAVIALEAAQGVEQPHLDPAFVDRIVSLQRQRQLRAATADSGVQVFDRSPVCSLALSRYLGYPPSTTSMREVERLTREGTYASRVFFTRNLGFVEPTAACRITFEQSLEFERLHEDTYSELGYEVIDIPKEPLGDRVALVVRLVEAFRHG